MRLITVHLPETWLQIIDDLIEAGLLANRAEFIRFCIYNQINFQAHLYTEMKRLALEKRLGVGVFDANRNHL